jgi:hypothetical protein
MIFHVHLLRQSSIIRECLHLHHDFLDNFAMSNNTSTPTIDYPPDWLPYCNQIENQLKTIFVQIHIDIVICAIILIGIAVLIHQFIRSKIFIHRNLLVKKYCIEKYY